LARLILHCNKKRRAWPKWHVLTVGTIVKTAFVITPFVLAAAARARAEKL
jgi:hypothetical protein